MSAPVHRLDATFVSAQIAQLRARHPEVWDDETLLADMLEGETKLHDFLAAVVKQMCEARVHVIGLDALINDLAARQSRYQLRIDGLRELAHKALDTAGLRRLELTQATLSIRPGSPKVIITDEKELPADCVRVIAEPDKTAIRHRLGRGESVAGALLSNAEPVLAMRIK